jgi:OmpA-OmpF porin, OOP family
MRSHLVPVAIVAALVSTPAAAQSSRWYVGGDIGVLLPRDTEVDIRDANTSAEFDNAVDLQHNTGFELDGELGYDFGMFKVEGELGYKHSNFDAVDPSADWINFLQNNVGGVIVDPSDIDLDEGIDIITVMANGLLDLGPDNGLGGYIGGGVGLGWAKAYDQTEGSFAWQLIAGVRYPVSSNVDVGLKYRYFDMSSLDYVTGTDIQGQVFDINLDGDYRSHSLLANATYNF